MRLSGRVLLLSPLFAGLLAACVTVTPGRTTVPSPQVVVGVSWGDFGGERWKADDAGLRSALAAAGATYISTDARSSPARQVADMESLISRGADVLVILAADADGIRPAVRAALDKGLPVIGYDRLIEEAGAFYVSFDNVEVGRQQAAAVLAAAPRGRYVLIKGEQTDPNADFLAAGQVEVLKPSLDSEAITIVDDSYTSGRDADAARAEMERALVANVDDIQAVVASNDSTAGGAIAALAARGMAGKVPVSGQDGDKAALNRVALGSQTVSVWKDARALGRVAARVAIELAGGTPIHDVTGASTFSGGKGSVPMNAVLLTPIAITRENLQVVIDAGWITQAEVCQGVIPASVPACRVPAPAVTTPSPIG